MLNPLSEPSTLDLWSSRIHGPFALSCLWGPFAFFALFRVVCNIGGVLGVSVGETFLLSRLGVHISRRFGRSSLWSISTTVSLNDAT